jgi:uncharacterized protein YbjT (DUF2867 family)/tryptophan-rich sensory protein
MKAGTNVNESLVLLAGATGYVGGRLLNRLESLGVRVRCLARRPEFLRQRVQPNTEVVAGDVLDPASLAVALQGVDTAYYLVHAMGSSGSFEEEDRRAAHNFGAAARAAGVRRIIYLGGLGDEREQLSPPLRSRHEVGAILRSRCVQVIEFRASIILGSGSLSFEMIRTLVERLPVMITPRWVTVPAQPIAIDDVLRYLVAALDHPIHDSRIYEIGGPDRVSYGDLIKEYARQRGLRRLILRVPVLTPYLSSLWLGLVTPVYARVGRALIESIRHPTVVRDNAAQREFTVEPVGHREAMAAALRNEDQELAETRWNDAVSASGNGLDGGETADKCLAMLLVLLAVCFGTAAVGAALTAGPVRDWYPTLRKPAWTPPDWVFGPVWTILYVLMALAAWFVWRRARGAASRTALGLFAVQLVLNAAWSGLFFTLRSPASAFAEIILLWCAIAATLSSFGRVSTLGASLLVPYLLWVTYAAALNGTIWRMNS